MQHLVVLVVVEQNDRRRTDVGGHEDGGAGDTQGHVSRQVCQEELDRKRVRTQLGGQLGPRPRFQVVISVKITPSDHQREPPAMLDLGKVRDQEREVHCQEEGG